MPMLAATTKECFITRFGLAQNHKKEVKIIETYKKLLMVIHCKLLQFLALNTLKSKNVMINTSNPDMPTMAKTVNVCPRYRSEYK